MNAMTLEKSIAAQRRAVMDRAIETYPDVHPLRLGLQFADSYNRADALLRLYYSPSVMPRAEWWSALGSNWSTCDNIGMYAPEFRRALRAASRADLDAAMDDDERRAFAALPDVLTVYRGCYPFNVRGLSWSLSRDVAEAFVTKYVRYARHNLPSYILTGRVSKRYCILKLGRNESEVVAPVVRVIGNDFAMREVCA